MGVVFCGHRGSGDHGCEDRLRGTCRLLPQPPEVYSACMEEDWRYGIAEVAPLYRQELCTGEQALMLVDRGAAVSVRKGIAWGWTPNQLSLSAPAVKRLAGFDAIVCPDKRSLRVLRDSGLGKKARLGPDTAFLVERQIRPLAGAFRQDTVGLCVSTCCRPYERTPGLLFRSYRTLIRYILDATSFQVALIPYCVQRGRDDRLLQQALKQEFRDSHRVFLRQDASCRSLRGDISLCFCVVGAAGAAAAWSCGVPALCLGVNGRSVGLAQTLFGPWQEHVVAIGALGDEKELTRIFRSFLTTVERQRTQLQKAVPLRRQMAAAWDWDNLRLAL